MRKIYIYSGVMICFLVFGFTIHSISAQETIVVEEEIVIDDPTLARGDLQRLNIDGSKTELTTNELILIELRTANKRLENIQTILWKNL